jgi:hypothetical protein
MTGHGLYTGWKFSEQVHCVEPCPQQNYIERAAKSRGLTIKIIGSRHVLLGEFLHFGHKEEEFKCYVQPRIITLDLRKPSTNYWRR